MFKKLPFGRRDPKIYLCDKPAVTADPSRHHPNFDVVIVVKEVG